MKKNFYHLSYMCIQEIKDEKAKPWIRYENMIEVIYGNC